MSPYSNLSLGTTPMHHPDEDLANFQTVQTQNHNVYLPKQSFGPPQTPV